MSTQQQVKLLKQKIQEWATLYKALKKDGKQLESANDFKKILAAVLPSVNALTQKGTEREQGENTLNEIGDQTTRIHTYKGKSSFKLLDKNGKVIKKEKIGKIVIKEGIEVVKLKTVVVFKNEEYTQIVVWLTDVYHKGFIPTGALEGEDENGKIKSKDLVKAFLNDLEHAVFRAEKRFYHHSEGIAKQYNYDDATTKWFKDEFIRKKHSVY